MRGTSLAPFFGFGRGGTAVAKWLNRLVLAAELAAGAGLFYLQYTRGVIPVGKWFLFAYPILFFIAVRIVNVCLSYLCQIAVVMIYGTDDGYEIEQRLAKKSQERSRRRERRNAKRIMSKKRAEDKITQASKRIIITDVNGPYDGEVDEQ